MAELIKSLNVIIANNQSCTDYTRYTHSLLCTGNEWSCLDCVFDAAGGTVEHDSIIKILGGHSERID